MNAQSDFAPLLRRAFAFAVLALALSARAADQPAGLDPETRFNMALQHLREGRSEMAVEEIKAAIKEDGKNAYFHKGLGMAYLQRREFEKAAEALRKALELNPYYTDARNDLGTALILSGRREEGKKEFLTAFNDPTYNAPEVAARNLGQAHFEEKKYEQALNWYRTSTQRNPKYADAWLGLADVYVVLGRVDEAVLQLQAGQRELPDSLALQLGYGDVCYRAGRLSDARDALENVARKDPAGSAGRRALELLQRFPQR
jgi:Tfp pilus assembly protein PilF